MSERLPGICDDVEGIKMAQFVKTGLGIKETLQGIEDVLFEAGYGDFVVATDRGSFHWQTAEHARAEMDEPEAAERADWLRLSLPSRPLGPRLIAAPHLRQRDDLAGDRVGQHELGKFGTISGSLTSIQQRSNAARNR